MDPLVYLLLRSGIGISFFGHGVVRLPKLAGFSAWMVEKFERSMVPDALVLPFSYALPIAELVIGLLVLLGLFTRTTLIAGAVVTLMLMFGTTMIESWDGLPSQMIHLVFFAVLIQHIEANRYSLDQKFKQ